MFNGGQLTAVAPPSSYFLDVYRQNWYHNCSRITVYTVNFHCTLTVYICSVGAAVDFQIEILHTFFFVSVQWWPIRVDDSSTCFFILSWRFFFYILFPFRLTVSLLFCVSNCVRKLNSLNPTTCCQAIVALVCSNPSTNKQTRKLNPRGLIGLTQTSSDQSDKT